MADDNLSEFISERVAATRKVMRLNIDPEAGELFPAIWFDCADCQTGFVVLPTFADGVGHLEIHGFVDGERAEADVGADGPQVEITIRRS